MEINIRPDPRVKHPLSLKFGLIELSDEEYKKRKFNILRNIGQFTTFALVTFAATLLFE